MCTCVCVNKYLLVRVYVCVCGGGCARICLHICGMWGVGGGCAHICEREREGLMVTADVNLESWREENWAMLVSVCVRECVHACMHLWKREGQTMTADANLESWREKKWAMLVCVCVCMRVHTHTCICERERDRQWQQSETERHVVRKINASFKY